MIFTHPLSVVESKNIGEGTRIWGWTHIMPGAKIGKNCNIGEHCYIENEVIIGDNCTIKNGVSLWDGIIIEDNVFIGPHAIFTNDKYPRSRNKDWKLLKTFIRRGATIGAGAAILCGTEIGEYSFVGMGAVVTKSVPKFAVVVGNPAKIIGYICYCGSTIIKERSKGKAECRKCSWKPPDS